MKASFYLMILTLFLLLSQCQPPQATEKPAETNETSFDSLLAIELGADDYGMRQYVMAFLKSGPIRSHDSTTAAKIQRAHLDNMTIMAEQGKLVFAGPFMDDFDIKGIYIFAVEDMAEAEALTNSDPAIKAGRLTMELHPFYGSAALMQINELHKRITKIDI